MKSKLLSVFVGLVIGNFGFQLIGPHHWLAAWDRSFFQAAALIAAWFVMRGKPCP